MATRSSVTAWRIHPMDRGGWQVTVHGVAKSWTYWATNTYTYPTAVYEVVNFMTPYITYNFLKTPSFLVKTWYIIFFFKDWLSFLNYVFIFSSAGSLWLCLGFLLLQRADATLLAVLRLLILVLLLLQSTGSNWAGFTNCSTPTQ